MENPSKDMQFQHIQYTKLDSSQYIRTQKISKLDKDVKLVMQYVLAKKHL